MQYYCEFDEIRDLDELRGANRLRAEKFANPLKYHLIRGDILIRAFDAPSNVSLRWQG
jgi:hypothetical protein